jgi:hypothetical protein
MLAGAITGQGRSAGSDAGALRCCLQQITKVGVSPVESLGSEVGGLVRCESVALRL